MRVAIPIRRHSCTSPRRSPLHIRRGHPVRQGSVGGDTVPDSGDTAPDKHVVRRHRDTPQRDSARGTLFQVEREDFY